MEKVDDMLEISSDYRARSLYVAERQGPAALGLLDSAYARDWGRFRMWCEARRLAPIGAEPLLVAQFLEQEADLGYSSKTLGHRLAAIGHMHRRQGAEPPLLKDHDGHIRATLLRIEQHAQIGNSLQATTTILRTVLLNISEDTLLAARDRALLALRIAGAFQLSELAALSLARIRREDNRLEIRLGKGSSKLNRNATLTIADDTVLQPVTLFDHWRSRSAIQAGQVFRQILPGERIGDAMKKDDVAEAIQARVAAAGFSDAISMRIASRKSSVHT